MEAEDRTTSQAAMHQNVAADQAADLNQDDSTDQRGSNTSLATDQRAPQVTFFATDGPERFARVGSVFLGRELRPEDVSLVDL